VVLGKMNDFVDPFAFLVGFTYTHEAMFLAQIATL
jgi:hypothetical protein